MPRRFLQTWCRAVEKKLSVRDRRRLAQLELSVVFMDKAAARKLNRNFRGRDYATDVLSFAGDGRESIGEIVLCPHVLLKQSREQAHSFRHELGLMTLHGILHLLGYDHEKGGRQAKKMWMLQNRIYASLERLLKS